MAEIGRGAEAVIYKEGGIVQKVRPKKGYRIAEIDTVLRKRRTAQEARILSRLCEKKISVPALLKTTEHTIEMEHIKGPLVKDVLDEQSGLARKIGILIAKLHDEDIIHGDLTTSNMILSGDEIFLIDFGLGYHSKRLEDKAVDIHVFLCSLESRHYRVKEKACQEFFKGYFASKTAKDVLKKLEVVESRGRYKSKKGVNP